MGMGKALRLEVTEWGILIMVIVVVSIIVLKFKTTIPNSNICPTDPNTLYNISTDLCTNASGVGTTNASVSGLGSTVDVFVAALSEPKNWVAIVIIGLIGFGLIKLFSKKK